MLKKSINVLESCPVCFLLKMIKGNNNYEMNQY